MTIEGKTVLLTGAGEVRELDRRTSDGIDVRLLWHPQTNRVTLAVHDEHASHRLVFDVDPGKPSRWRAHRQRPYTARR